jgi:hypothetical protein
MPRRTFIGAPTGSLLPASLAAGAKPASTSWRIGVLVPDRPGGLEALVEGLRELGYIEGQNLILDHRRFTSVD